MKCHWHIIWLVNVACDMLRIMINHVWCSVFVYCFPNHHSFCRESSTCNIWLLRPAGGGELFTLCTWNTSSFRWVLYYEWFCSFIDPLFCPGGTSVHPFKTYALHPLLFLSIPAWIDGFASLCDKPCSTVFGYAYHCMFDDFIDPTCLKLPGIHSFPCETFCIIIISWSFH